MNTHSSIPPEADDIAKKVRSGEFFRESRAMYDIMVHDAMAERYFYVIITGLAALIFFVALGAMDGFYPLQRSVPFIVSTQNIAEDRPNIRSLITYKGENPDEAMLRFLVQNYVILREDYDISLIERNAAGVKAHSSEELYLEYERLMDPRNPVSPIALYQRHSKRRVSVQSVRVLAPDFVQVTFDAFVESKNETQKSRWQADISSTYGGVAIDNKTGEMKPLVFTVNKYTVKRLQDNQ